ncbi:MAG TPA: hypothetical protein VLL48_12570, partial [Longimicrobiales bacterium]|nr:hypothetical protein [Longimicrobiales bacterium]
MRPTSLLVGALAGALLAGNGLLAQDAERFTIADVLSAPMPSELVAAPSGARFAWIQNAEGVRNLWVAEEPEFQGRPITAYAEDDGQEIADPVFTPDGAAVVFVRGGAPNREGEFPN